MAYPPWAIRTSDSCSCSSPSTTRSIPTVVAQLRLPAFIRARRNGLVTDRDKTDRGNTVRHPPGVVYLWMDSLRTRIASIARVLRSDEGQGMVEYALILVLIAVVVIVVLIVLGNQVQNVFCNISGGLGQ